MLADKVKRATEYCSLKTGCDKTATHSSLFDQPLAIYMVEIFVSRYSESNIDSTARAAHAVHERKRDGAGAAWSVVRRQAKAWGDATQSVVTLPS